VNSKDLLTQAAAKLTEAKRIRDGGTVGPDQITQISALVGEHDNLLAQAKTLQSLESRDVEMNAPADLKAAHLGWRESAPDEGNTPVDLKAWREFELQMPWGERKSFRYHVPLAVQSKGYQAAFESFLRKGTSEMGPNDRKTLSEGIDTAGGFLVPEDALSIITRKVATFTVIRQLARVLTTSRDIATWPRINYATDNNYTSGVRFTWTGETPALATTHRVTDPVFGNINVPVHTAMASMPLTNNLIEDSAFDVLSVSSELIGEAYALGEENVFINGTGVNQPSGVLFDAETTGPTAVHLGSITQPSQAGMVNLEAALPSQYERNASFLAAKATYAQIRQSNQTTSGQLLWGSSLAEGYLQPMRQTLLGYPVYKSEFVPAIATTSYSLILGDWSGYYIFDRVGLSIARNSTVYQETDITVLIAKKRVGGYCVEPYRFQLGQMSI
jgi:HK97 family phage major capsid protein